MENDNTVVEGRFTRDQIRWPFQLDETGEDDEFRVVKVNEHGTVVGDFIFAQAEDGDVLLIVRRFDESEFGSVNFVLV